MDDLNGQFRNTQITNQPSRSDIHHTGNWLMKNELKKMPPPTQFYHTANVNLQPFTAKFQQQTTSLSPGSSLTTQSQTDLSDNLLKWSGELPASNLNADSSFAAKVFVGGTPWDITEGKSKTTLSNLTLQFSAESLMAAFSQFGLKLVSRPNQLSKGDLYFEDASNLMLIY